MLFVHSFWSKPLYNSKFNKFNTLLPVILHDYAISVAYIHKNGHKIKLFADQKGIELLGFLPYDEIVQIDNLEDKSIHFAAQIKFEALKRMSLDDCLIDGDLFMKDEKAFNRLNELKNNNDFVYSMFEPNEFILSSNIQTDKYKNIQLLMRKYSQYFKHPYELDRFITDYKWPNTSLMSFQNQLLKDQYIQQYEYYKQLLSGEDFGQCWPDIIIEQRHMKKLLDTGYSSAPMIENFPADESNNYALEIGFTHLGYAKIYYDDIIKTWLQDLDEKLYNKCEQQAIKFII